MTLHDWKLTRIRLALSPAALTDPASIDPDWATKPQRGAIRRLQDRFGHLGNDDPVPDVLMQFATNPDAFDPSDMAALAAGEPVPVRRPPVPMFFMRLPPVPGNLPELVPITVTLGQRRRRKTAADHDEAQAKPKVQAKAAPPPFPDRPGNGGKARRCPEAPSLTSDKPARKEISEETRAKLRAHANARWQMLRMDPEKMEQFTANMKAGLRQWQRERGVT